MIEFIEAAFPWVAIGLAVAFSCANKGRDSFAILFSTAIGIAFGNYYGKAAIGAGIGILSGILIGIFDKKQIKHK